MAQRQTISEYVEKKSRKALRKGLKGHRLESSDTFICEGALVLALAKRIITLPNRIVLRRKSASQAKDGKRGILLFGKSSEREAEDYLEQLFGIERKAKAAKSASRQLVSAWPVAINLLERLSEEEIAAYAKNMKIAYKKKDGNPDVSTFIDAIAKHHPETRASLAKSVRVLKELPETTRKPR